MEQRRRAEILVTNLRWGLLVAILGLADERHVLAAFLPFVVAVAAYNAAARLVCSRKDSYRRLAVPVAYGTRLLDILVITMALPLYVPRAWYFAGAYLFVAFGAGLVLRLRWGAAFAALATAAYSLRMVVLAQPGAPTASFKQVALMGMLCLFSALVSESLSYYERDEDSHEGSLDRLQSLQRLGTAWTMDYGPGLVQVLAESALTYLGSTECTIAIWGGEITPVGITVERSGGSISCRPARTPSAPPSGAASETTVVASGQDIETFADGNLPGLRLARQVMVKGKKAWLQLEARGLRQPLADDERSALAILVSHISMVLEQAHTAAVLQHAAQTDAMTGLHNKRTLMRRLAEEVGKAASSDHTLALLMIDLDGFKNYNDVQGHLAGDSFLERLGDVLRHHTRPQDVAGRFGGDEFVLALPGCDAVAASDVARRLLSDVEHIQQDDERAWPHVSASCGVSVLPADGTSVDGLVKAADTCLLYAKQLGKKRLFVSGLSLDQDLSRRQPLR